METVYSSENKPKSKVIKTSVLIDENGRLFARLTDSGVLLNVDKLSADDRVESVPGCIVLATPLATAVPEKLFDYSNRNLFLEAVGIYPNANHEVLVSSAVDGVITVMAVERECAEWLKSYKVPVYHLLQLNLLRAKGKQFRSGRVVLLNMSAGTLAVTVHIDSRLEMAEIYPVANNDEILFVAKTLEQQYLASSGAVRIWGLGSAECYALLSEFVEDTATDKIDGVENPEYNNLVIGNI